MTYAPDFNKDLAIFLLQICGLTYEQYKKDGEFPIPQDFKLVKQFKARALGRLEWFGFILESEDMIVTAFRGTQSDLDWVMDAEAFQTEFPYIKQCGLVHHGFLSVYESCRERIIETYATLPKNKTICITGHSLGAGIATLHALDAASNVNFQNTIMYNFASPRVGNKQFVRRYGKTVLESIRFVNTDDIVPKVPPIAFYGPLSKQAWFYSHVESPIEFSLKTGTISGNHSLEIYQKGLESEMA